MGAAMTLYELLDIIESEHDRINMLWNFFIWIHLTIMGAMVLLPRRIGFIERLVVIFAYSGFMYMNRNAVIDAYDYLFILQEEVAAFAGHDGAGAGLVEYWRAMDFDARLNFLPYLHQVAAGVTIFAILAMNFVGRKER